MVQVADMIVIAAMADTMLAAATAGPTAMAVVTAGEIAMVVTEGTATEGTEGAAPTPEETAGGMVEVTDQASIEMGGIEMVDLGKCLSLLTI